MTNGDWIRSMTDKELAVFLLTDESKVCTHCEFYDGYGCSSDEIVCGTAHLEGTFKKWLSSETTECKN